MNPNRAGVRNLSSMKTTNSVEEISEAASLFRNQVMELREKCETLEEVGKREILPRLDRLGTMVQALDRDIREVETNHGADLDTTTELAATIETELSNLIPEVEAILTGNPTTVSAVFDASLHAVEQAGKAIRKAGSKITNSK